MSYSTSRRDNQFKTLIYEEELDHISGWVNQYPDLETGGDLFGFWTHSGSPIIQFVLGPGKNSRHNPTSFYQDREHLIKAGEILREKHGLQHIGEWHSHHQMGLAQPSGGDVQTVLNALRTYNFPRFLLCIANLRPSEHSRRSKYTVNVGCFLFTSSSNSYQTGSWVILPDKSLIRKDLLLTGSGSRVLLENPRLNEDWQVDETTLQPQRLVSTEPIQISQEVWYATEKGKALLKKLSNSLSVTYKDFEIKDFEMQREMPSEQIHFTFKIRHKNTGYLDRWQIDLPNDFPQSSPLIQVNRDSHKNVTNWDGSYSPVRQIEDCIYRYYKSEVR